MAMILRHARNEGDVCDFCFNVLSFNGLAVLCVDQGGGCFCTS